MAIGCIVVASWSIYEHDSWWFLHHDDGSVGKRFEYAIIDRSHSNCCNHCRSLRLSYHVVEFGDPWSPKHPVIHDRQSIRWSMIATGFGDPWSPSSVICMICIGCWFNFWMSVLCSLHVCLMSASLFVALYVLLQSVVSFDVIPDFAKTFGDPWSPKHSVIHDRQNIRWSSLVT